jgi:hypothetical protein
MIISKEDKMKNKIFAGVLVLLLLITTCYALDTAIENRLKFGHVLYVDNVSVNPESVSPGSTAIIRFNVENTANDIINDVRIRLELPSQIATYNDVNEKKFAFINPGLVQDTEFSIIVLPNTDEGVYKIPVITSYLNSVGDERADNQTISVIVKSLPHLYAQLKSSEVYDGNNMGTISIRIVNNNVGNIKFLSAELASSKEYSIISSAKEYVGDLNSDDFSDVNFKIKVTSSKDEISLPLLLNYKDSLNQDYQETLNVPLKMLSARELGIKKSYGWVYLLIIILAVAGFIYYKKYKKNIIKDKKWKFLLRKDSIFK